MSTQLDLYQQVILEHNRKPKNFHPLAAASHKAEGFNPLCGDHLWIYVQIDDTGLIQEASFQGSGCAISKASASLMTTALKGKSAPQARELIRHFQDLLKGQYDPELDPHKLGKLKIFSSIWQYPARIKCAGLAWHTLHGALEQQSQPVSTEGQEVNDEP